MSGPALGLTYAGKPRDPRSWSGTPAGIIGALEDLGATVAAHDARAVAGLHVGLQVAVAPRYFPGALPHPGRVLALADLGPELGRLRSRAASRRFAAAEPVDAAVQVGTDHLLRTAVPRAVITDRTVALALSTGYPRWLALPKRVQRALTEQERFALEASTACCALTHWAADSVKEQYGLPPERIHVIGVGANSRPATSARDWQQPIFLFVAREWERKGGPALLRAFAKVRGVVPHARLHIAGGHPRIDQSGVTAHGVVTPATVAQLMAAATCFVMPSTVEPAGIVHAEALAAGIPSIGTSVGGPATIIGDCGELVPPGDTDTLAAAMIRLAQPERAMELGARARARAELFTWRAVGGRILASLGLAPGTGCSAPLPPPPSQ